MKKKVAALIGFVLAIELVISSGAQAGVYADDLARCMVSSTSSKDKIALVRWMFAGIALHPDVASLSNVTDAMRDEINRNTATLVERLVTQSCRKQSNEAFRYEGKTAFEQGFGVLGKVAMNELMSNENVSVGFRAYAKYMDKLKLEAIGK